MPLQIVLEYSPGAWEVNQKWEEYPMIAGMLDLCAPSLPLPAKICQDHPICQSEIQLCGTSRSSLRRLFRGTCPRGSGIMWA